MKTLKNLAILILTLSLISCSSPQPKVETQPNAVATSTPKISTTEPPTVTLTPATDWQTENHIHGIAIDPNNPNILYIGTHHGLIQYSKDKKWSWVGKDRSDYMGFAAHPTDSNRLYSSGHPHTGGNLGFRVTEDYGETWKVLSKSGVDFHALAISSSNPNLIYGWATSGEQGFLVSKDGGKNWESITPVGLGNAVFSLTVNPENSEQIFATTQGGLYESKNGGKNWELIPGTDTSLITGLALIPENNKMLMVGYRLLESDPGIYKSSDSGKTWEKFGTGTEGVILYLATHPKNPQIIYGVNEQNAVFHSSDGGKIWHSL
ncbi:F510_1955 family glycosylhydrolase [Planktothrix paucivesiculata]|uniref:Uncharacterized protein n=1 Tax=Planktothrix paucivesiculata PCC 9631 TaxID=671071 RepID=A0A7Z9BRD7_9CYAN|nr:hypothetical protein [Planktothrix paucivesiculata]VXD20731.1 conserved exported hypothetical protein [Planktothrix paucivesiculata PCC 9631]